MLLKNRIENDLFEINITPAKPEIPVEPQPVEPAPALPVEPVKNDCIVDDLVLDSDVETEDILQAYEEHDYNKMKARMRRKNDIKAKKRKVAILTTSTRAFMYASAYVKDNGAIGSKSWGSKEAKKMRNKKARKYDFQDGAYYKRLDPMYY